MPPSADTPPLPFAAHHLLTLRDLLRYAVSQFNEAELAFGHGSDNAWDEAVFLLLHTLHLPLDALEPFLDARLLPGERQRCLDIVQRRVQTRQPAAYLTGAAWLQGHRFLVNENVIVPRSPISELLAEQLAPWVEAPEEISTVLDMCTGSGCLAILAAHAFEHAQVDACDISGAALEVARQNIALHHLQDRVHLYASDLFSQLPPTPYDLIVCNPPYVNAQSMQALPAEYRHEPALALEGGADGMDFIRRLLAQASGHLAPKGLLILEIGHEYAHFTAAFPTLEPVWLSTANTQDQILLLTRAQLLTQKQS